MNDKWVGAIIIDDPLKPSEAEAIRMREDFLKALRGRPGYKKVPPIFIQSRLHEEDEPLMLTESKGFDEWQLLHADTPTN